MGRRGLSLLLALLVGLMVGGVSPAGPALAEGHLVVAATGSISGRVTVPAGVDVTAVQVNVWSSGSGNVSTWPAPDGSYAVGGLAPGRYTVEFIGWNVGLIHEDWNDVRSGDPTVVVVGSGPVTGIDAALELGAVVSGTIRTNSDCDLTGVTVGLFFSAPGVYADAVVAPDGRWSLAGVPTGSYGIVFDGRWVGLARQMWQGGSASRDGISLVSLTAGQVTTGIDITLNGPTGCVGLRPYVWTVYLDLLGREPDQEGMNDWTNRLAWGASYDSVANGITGSDEYRGRLIGATYQDYLDRAPEPAGLAFWLAQMRAGWQIEDVQAGFISSDEFYARHGSTPHGWVTGLYQTVLHRAPADAEVQWWLSRMASGMSRRDVARGFLFSTEHLIAVVDAYYVDLLGRHIDPTGTATWVGLIQRGHRDEEIVAGIVASEEYRSMVPSSVGPVPYG